MKINSLYPVSIIMLGYSFFIHTEKPVLALVKVPVADLCGIEVGSFTKRIGNYYQTLPYAPDTGSYGCLRIHQLLYNEIVAITKEYPGGEVAVDIPGCFFLDGFHRKRNDCWMLKKDLLVLTSLPTELRKALPPAVDYTKPVADYSKNVLILREPWSGDGTKKFSVGTRFVRQSEQDTVNAYAIIYIDPLKRRIKTGLVSKDKALVYEPQSFQQSKKQFLSIIRAWTDKSNGFVPYVYGGASLRELCKDIGFTKIQGTKGGSKATYWDRQSGTMMVPRSGFDCSSMILRAAQMAFLPYYYKNTLTLVKYLSPLKHGESIEEGDLVWYSGHVMVVSDISKNLLIESVGYESGYGYVHEIPVHKVFHGIQNYEQLKHTHLARQFVYRLNSDLQKWRSVYRVKIFKLKSILDIKL